MGDKEKALERFERYREEYLNVEKTVKDAVASDIPIKVVTDMAYELARDLSERLLRAVTPADGRISLVMLPMMDLVTRSVADTIHKAYLAADMVTDTVNGSETQDQVDELFRHFLDEMEG